MRKLSQTEELAKILASRARHHLLTPEQVSRAMEEQEYDVAGLDALYEALEARGIRVEEEDADLPLLDEAQIGRLEHELSAEGVALDDPVKAYLKEIGQVPLLSAEAGPCCQSRGCGRPPTPQRGEPAAGGLGGQALRGQGAALPRPHPGGQPRPDEGGGKV